MELQNRREDRPDAGRQCPLLLICHVQPILFYDYFDLTPLKNSNKANL